jgi:post-segregation antitoxin (ccd killing protein)
MYNKYAHNNNPIWRRILVTKDANKTTRLNIMVSEYLDKCLTESAKKRDLSKSAFVRLAVERECARTQDEILAVAAEAVAHIYETDKELTAFSLLDAEDFA